MISLTCDSYRAVALATGGIRLEIGLPAPAPTARTFSTQDVADRLGKSTEQVDKLARRNTHPLPLDREGPRSTLTRAALNRWLLGLTDAQTAEAVFGV